VSPTAQVCIYTYRTPNKSIGKGQSVSNLCSQKVWRRYSNECLQLLCPEPYVRTTPPLLLLLLCCIHATRWWLVPLQRFLFLLHSLSFFLSCDDCDGYRKISPAHFCVSNAIPRLVPNSTFRISSPPYRIQKALYFIYLFFCSWFWRRFELSTHHPLLLLLLFFCCRWSLRLCVPFFFVRDSRDR
jgi:hypothetical protein